MPETVAVREAASERHYHLSNDRYGRPIEKYPRAKAQLTRIQLKGSKILHAMVRESKRA